MSPSPHLASLPHALHHLPHASHRLPYTSHRSFLTCRPCRVALSPRLFVTHRVVALPLHHASDIWLGPVVERQLEFCARATPFLRSMRGAGSFFFPFFFSSTDSPSLTCTPSCSLFRHASTLSRPPFATRCASHAPPSPRVPLRHVLPLRPFRYASSLSRRAFVTHCPLTTRCPSSRVTLHLVARHLSRRLDVATLGSDLRWKWRR